MLDVIVLFLHASLYGITERG